MYIFLSLLLVLGFLFLYLHRIFTFRNKKSFGTLPPGNFGWPIVGESLEFASTLLKGCPEKFVHDRMRKYSPAQVFKTSILGEKMSVICGPLGNKLLFTRDQNLLVPWWPSSIDKIFLSGRPVSTASTRTRQNIVENLKLEAVYNYVPIIHNMVEDHLNQEWIPKNEVKVYPLMKMLIFSISCRLFVGLHDSQPIAKYSDIFSDVTAAIFAFPFDFPGTIFNRGIKAASRLKKEVVKMIEQRRNQLISSGDTDDHRDMFSKILLETDENGEFFTDLDNADQVFGLLLASHDTTTSTIMSVIYYLADHPIIYARVLEEQMEISNSKGGKESSSSLTKEDIQKMKYSRNVINEALRIAAPTPGIFRDVKTDISFGGRTIPKGWKIFMSIHATHKNEEYFANPEEFDPSRFEGNGPLPFTFVPFGGGPSMCPGSEFARLQILIIIHCLVTKFRWEKLIPNEKLQYNPMPLPEKGLPIRLLPHTNN